MEQARHELLAHGASFQFLPIDGDESRLKASYGLRYQVYCVERGFLNPADYNDELESDEFDGNSLHFGAVSVHGPLIGTIRLVREGAKAFPLAQHCNIDLSSLPPRTAEISRLAVSKTYRRRVDDDIYGISPDALSDRDPGGLQRRRRPEIVLGLYKIMYQESKRQGIDYWLAAMERSLVRLLWRYSFTFEPIGPEVDYYGPVTPYIAKISDIETNVKALRPSLYKEFTRDFQF